MSTSLLSVLDTAGATTATAIESSSQTKVDIATSSESSSSDTQQPHAAPMTVKPLDFIGSSGAVKDLFALPYAIDRPISVAVHNMGGTLLIDGDFDEAVKTTSRVHSIHRAATREKVQCADKLFGMREDHGTAKTQSVFKLPTAENSRANMEALTLVNNVIQQAQEQPASAVPDPLLDTPAEEYAAKFIPTSPEPREYLSWKFHDMNLMVGSDALIYRSGPSTALAVRVEDAVNLRDVLNKHEATVAAGSFVADHGHSKLQQEGKPSYAEATRLRETSKSLIGGVSDRSTSQVTFAAPDLDQVRLQTCIVPVSNESIGSKLASDSMAASEEDPATTCGIPLSPVSTVLDTYLDNIMANVPQLALCLREKGFIQSVKLLNTEEIPSMLLKPGTLDTTVPFESLEAETDTEEIFSPKIMEMNAHALLRFLKTNCSKDNATYLLRRDAGCQNIQLYDISSISAQRKQKWLWWLAMISYRFSNRLRHLSLQTVTNKALRRNFRVRQRSLLQNTLELLETMSDMGGNTHESLIAAVCENLADTFLMGGDEEICVAAGELQTTQAAVPIVLPPQAVSAHQPYTNVSVDALTKAQDHLVHGIRELKLVLDRILSDSKKRTCKKEKFMKSSPRGERHSRIRPRDALVMSVNPESSSDSEDDDFDWSAFGDAADPVVTQLFGLNHKLIDVSLRLAEIHLKNYWSSSAMQNLRTAAQRIADSLNLAQLIDHERGKDDQGWLSRVQLQYTWLWELCGHFARSFAADEHWRDRGHASGDDVVSVLQDVEMVFRRPDLNVHGPLSLLEFTETADPLIKKSKGKMTILSPIGIVDFSPEDQKQSTDLKVTGCETAKRLLDDQKILQRDERRVLVAASLAYSRAVFAFDKLLSKCHTLFDKKLVEVLRQRLGDACNETGKVLLKELRSLLISNTGSSDRSLAQTAAAVCFSAEFWFLEGLASFEVCADLRNLALLRCNLCQCYKLRANGLLATLKVSKDHEPNHAEYCLQEAANHLLSAHEALETRETDSATWDMVSGELAATFLVLGVRRRQSLIGTGNTLLILQALRLSPGKERSIVEPMERSLDIYKQMGNLHQAAATSYQLALFYSRIWTCQNNESKTRDKLSSAFNHYGLAYTYFLSSVRGNESTFCLICLDFAKLYATVSGEEGLTKALERCLDTLAAFSPDVVDAATKDLGSRHTWFQQMETLASSVEDRVFNLLKSLVKLQGSMYKDVYRAALTCKMSQKSNCSHTAMGDATLDAAATHVLELGQLLGSIKETYNSSKNMGDEA